MIDELVNVLLQVASRHMLQTILFLNTAYHQEYTLLVTWLPVLVHWWTEWPGGLDQVHAPLPTPNSVNHTTLDWPGFHQHQWMSLEFLQISVVSQQVAEWPLSRSDLEQAASKWGFNVITVYSNMVRCIMCSLSICAQCNRRTCVCTCTDTDALPTPYGVSRHPWSTSHTENTF